MKQEPEKVLRRLKSCQPGDIAVSSITVAELRYGVEKSQAREKNNLLLDSFLISLDVVEFNHKAADIYGALRAGLEKKGLPIGPLDYLIAAQAVASGLTLVTNNTKEFKRIEGLLIEDWSH